MLHNSLLALATAFSDDPRIRDYRARLYFVNEAKRLLESECRTPNICAVHALSILASFYSSNGDHMLGTWSFHHSCTGGLQCSRIHILWHECTGQSSFRIEFR